MKKHGSTEDPCRCNCSATLNQAVLKEISVYRDGEGKVRCSRCSCFVATTPKATARG